MRRSKFDIEILELLAAGPQPVAALLGGRARATVYRRVAALLANGLIGQSDRGYSLTAVGERALAERDAQVFTDGLSGVYTPLTAIPTRQHAAQLELMLAAVALRQHTEQEDRHAGFLIAGPTLRWKSSFAEFLALTIGVESATHITDLRTERGQSLWMRRGATGAVVSQRDLLTAPVAVFDEYQEADTAVRRAVAPFLTGRRRIPLENDVISLTPVPLVLMNPSPGATLAERTGFTEAQLRRLIPLDVTALSMPDLALMGRRAVIAAREAGPLTVPIPRGPLDAWREPVVQSLRAVLTPEGLTLIDVEVVLGLGRGMTAWLRPVVALRQILYNLLLVTETVGWVKPGWVEVIRAFPHDTHRALKAGMSTTAVQPTTMGHRIALFAERTEPGQKGDAMSTRESVMPSFAVSDVGKVDLIWLCRETGRSPDAVISLFAEQYRMLRSEGREIEDLEAIVRLRKACAAADVSVAELREYLDLKTALSGVGIAVHEIRDAVAIGAAIDAAGFSWQDARDVGELLAAFAEAGIDVMVLETFRTTMARYATLGYDVRRLAALDAVLQQLENAGLSMDEMAGHLDHLKALQGLGLDPDAADALAGALNAAGMRSADQRAATLARAVAIGCGEADRARLTRETERLARELTSLQDSINERRTVLAGIQAEITGATQERDRMREEIGILDQEGAERYDALRAAEGLERLLLGETTLSDPFWAKLEELLALRRRRGSQPTESRADGLTGEIAQDVRRFLERLAAPAEHGVAAD